MFDHNNPLYQIGDLDLNEYANYFERKSITRYRLLYDLITRDGAQIKTFKKLNSIFVKDIRLRRKLAKYVYYFENKLGANITNFMIDNWSDIEKHIHKNKFVVSNSETPKKLIKLNKRIKQARVKEIKTDLADRVTFGDKLLIYWAFKHLYLIKKIPNEISIFTSKSNLQHCKNIRNSIAHHEFIIHDDDSLNSLIPMIEFIDNKKRWRKKFEKLLKKQVF